MIFFQQFGIPMHNGLMYAIGIAIMMEGVLSASYHVCPSSSNYQFGMIHAVEYNLVSLLDTSFMYMIGALGILKIYQLRHPDVNANAHISFAVMAMFIFLAMCGVVSASLNAFSNIIFSFEYFNDSVPFWAIFAFCYVLIMFCVSIEFYFKGQWRLSTDIIRSTRYAIRSSRYCSCIIPAFKVVFCILMILKMFHFQGRFVFLLIGNSINLAL